jgi:hypothetical protein
MNTPQNPPNVGDVIQVTSPTHPFFPLILTVKKITPNNVLAYLPDPNHVKENALFFHIPHTDYTYVGKAHFALGLHAE